MKDKLLIFLHIPKTGGTTLRNIIYKQYDEKEIWFAYHDLPLETSINHFSKEELKKLKCLMAHMKFGVHRCFTRSCNYITMLRNPIDRVISLYYSILNAPNNAWYDKLQNVSLKEFVSEERFLGQTANQQIGMIVEKNSPLHLSRAKKNLNKHFSVVGITEMFDESLFLMKKTLDWNNIFYTKKNVMKHRPSKEEVAKETIEMIKENNKLDMELYKYVKKNLKERIKELDPKAKQELDTFIRKNKEFGE